MPKKQKLFSSMTRAQKRVAIAKDVIKQVRAHHFQVKTGVYIRLRNRDDEDTTTADKAFFNRRQRKPCVVCAKGALVCSTVRLFNKYHGSIEALGDEVETVLRRNFGARNGDLIEVAFEKWNWDDYSVNSYGLSEAAVDAARAFGCRFRSRTKRLIAIMRNIIQNNGTFIP